MARRIFASSEMLSKIDPDLLLRMLHIDKEALQKWMYVLPDTIDSGIELNCDLIAKELTDHGIPDSVAEILAMVHMLSGKEGWELIQHRAKRESYPLQYSTRLSPADHIVRMMLDDGEDAIKFLTKVASLFQAKQRVAYTMFPRKKGFTGQQKKLDEIGLEDLRKSIATQLVRKGLIEDGQQMAVKIHDYGIGEETMYIVRYPGQLSRTMGWDPRGLWKNYVFNPARYDTIIHDPINNALKTNVKQSSSTVEAIYRMTFAHALYQTENVFMDDRNVVGMGEIGRKPLKEIFHAGGINGLQSIRLISIQCVERGKYPVECAFKVTSDDNLCDTDKAQFFTPSQMVNESRLVKRFVVRFVLERGNFSGLLSVERGNSVSYPRDISPTVLEQWLRARGFIQKESTEGRPADFWARSGKAAVMGGHCLESWQVYFGDAYEIAQRFLTRTDDVADSYPHPMGGLPLKVTKKNDDFYAVDEDGEGSPHWIEPKKLNRENVVAYTFALEQACAALITNCGLRQSWGIDGGLRRLGYCDQKLVYGYFGPIEDAVRPLVSSLAGRDDVGCVMVPSIDEGIASFARGVSASVVSLNERFSFLDGGLVGTCGKQCSTECKGTASEQLANRVLHAVKAVHEEKERLLIDNDRLKSIIDEQGEGALAVIERIRSELTGVEFDLFTLLVMRENGDVLTLEEIGRRSIKRMKKQAVSQWLKKWKTSKPTVWKFIDQVRNPKTIRLFSEIGDKARNQLGIDPSYGYKK